MTKNDGTTLRSALREGVATIGEDERGDVPGWVLITLMTAALVAGIWTLAGPALSSLFEDAIARISGM